MQAIMTQLTRITDELCSVKRVYRHFRRLGCTRDGRRGRAVGNSEGPRPRSRTRCPYVAGGVSRPTRTEARTRGKGRHSAETAPRRQSF